MLDLLQVKTFPTKPRLFCNYCLSFCGGSLCLKHYTAATDTLQGLVQLVPGRCKQGKRLTSIVSKQIMLVVDSHLMRYSCRGSGSSSSVTPSRKSLLRCCNRSRLRSRSRKFDPRGASRNGSTCRQPRQVVESCARLCVNPASYNHFLLLCEGAAGQAERRGLRTTAQRLNIKESPV